MKEKKTAHIFPPFVDAYRGTGEPDEETVSFKKFTEWMECHACEWGLQGVGEMVLSNTPARFNNTNKVIVCLGYWGSDKYIAVAPADCNREDGVYWLDSIEVIKHNFPNEWDVT